MPTGYTAAIKDGISFQTFAMTCARAMGACVMMRDDPFGTQIPERFEPSDYHQKKLDLVRAQLAELEGMTEADFAKAAEEAYQLAEDERLNRLAEFKDLRSKYQSMLDQVVAWESPSDNHIGFKQFMVQQITDSIRFDCDESYYQTPIPRKTPAEWFEAQKALHLRDIDYHTTQYAEEISRTDDRNTWIQLLRDSLKETA